MKIYRKKDHPNRTPVTMNGAQPEVVLGIMLAATVFEDRGYRFTITELMRTAKPGRSSLHPYGLAFDCRIWDVPNREALLELVGALREALGDEWDVVLKDTHIHCELDVKDD